MKAIIFDFDGVILDSVQVKTNAFSEMYSQYGKDIQKEVIKYHLLNGGISRYEKFKYYHDKFLNIKISDYEVNKLANKFSSIVFEKVCNSEFISGASEFLIYASKKYKTFICTGTPEKEIIPIVNRIDIDFLFDDIYGSPNSKTIIINKILTKYNLNSNDVLFIGDAMTDYNAAKETNLQFVGIRNKETSFPKETIIVDDLMQIINLFNL
jgi:phosphoglycolate phosphatase-like HAD superfamily hydrolase